VLINPVKNAAQVNVCNCTTIKIEGRTMARHQCGVIMQMSSGFAPVPGFFAVCSAVFVLATLFISLDEVRHG
jgi:hypothetical protein